MKKFAVWYEPYELQGEMDCIETEAENEAEARRFGNTWGWVCEVNEIK